MTAVHEITTYQFNELDEAAKERARDWYRETMMHDQDWHEFVLDDAKGIGDKLGIRIDNIYYSGFWSQGDGACFTGYYSYEKGSVAEIKKNYPATWTDRQTGEVHESKGNKELHEIAEALWTVQRKNFYKLSASISHRGHYYHELCTDITVHHEDDSWYHDWRSNWADTEEEVKDALRDFMRWIYRRLEEEWEYQNSDEIVDENIIGNEYEFTEDGRRYAY